MAKRNYKYDATVDLSNVPQNNYGYYQWSKAIGCIVPFSFDNDNLTGKFKIIDYKIPEGLTKYHVYHY